MWWGFGVGSAVLMLLVTLVFNRLDRLDTRMRDIEHSFVKRSDLAAEHNERDAMLKDIYARLRELEQK
jgi:hypothetical protein